MAELGDNTNEEIKEVETVVIPAAEDVVVIPAAEEVVVPATEEVIVPKTYTDADLIARAKENGRDVESVDDLWKPFEVEKIVEKEVNPYDSVLDAEDRQYLDFKKETGRSRKDFEALNQDYDKVNPLILARELIRRGSDEDLSNDEIDEHLEEKFNINLSNPDSLDKFDKITLNNFVKSLRDEKKAEQEKYKQPLPPKEISSYEDVVLLDNGFSMKRADYEAMATANQLHIKEAIEAVNSVAPSTFKFTVEEDGVARELSYSHELSTEDKQRLVSLVSDVSGYMEKKYRAESGFKHIDFEEDAVWMDKEFRGKAISAMLQASRAEAIEELLKTGNNVNFSRQPLQLDNKQREGVKTVPVGQLLTGDF